MSATVPTKVEVFFGLNAAGGDYFTVGDATKGQLDGSFGLADADGEASDISEFVKSISVRRGRRLELDDFRAGTCVARMHNYDGRFLTADLDTDGTATYGADAIRPGRRCRVTVEGITVFDGRTEDWNYDYRQNGRSEAEMIAEDALSQLARISFTEWTTTEQSAGARVGAVLDRNEVGFGANRDIDDGGSTMQSDFVSYGSNVVNYLNLIAISDLGRLFVTRDGVLTFRDRRTIAGAEVELALGCGRLSESLLTEDGEEILTEDGEPITMVSDTLIDGVPIHRIEIEQGSEVLYTSVSVDRENGIAQTVNDALAQVEYGVRSLRLGGLLLSSDEASKDMASFLLNAYSTPRLRMRRVSINLNDVDQTDRASVLALDLGSVVTATWTPTGMDAALQQTLVVEGISYQTDVASSAVVTFDLAPRLQESVFIVGDATFGALDGVGALAY